MTAIIIISAVILLAVFLLTSYVKIEFEYDSDFFVKVKYLCFSRILMPETKKSIRRKKRKEKKKKKKQEKLLKKREKLRRKRLRGQHLKSNKGKGSGSGKSSDRKASGGGKSSDGENGSSVKKTLSDGTSPPVSPKSATAQQAQQAAKGTEAKNTDFEAFSGKSGNVNAADKDNPKKSSEGEDEKPKADLNLIVSCINAAKPFVKRVFKRIRIYDVFAEIVVGGSDAAKTAISYGIHCAAVYGAVRFLKNTVNFKAKKIDIKADFDLEKTDYYFYCKLKLRLSTLLYCLLWGTAAVQRAMKGDTEKGRAEKTGKATKKAA